jgi:hypothetical protein
MVYYLAISRLADNTDPAVPAAFHPALSAAIRKS